MNIISLIKKPLQLFRRWKNTPSSLWLYKIGHSCVISRRYIVLPSKKCISIGCGCTIMDWFRIETVTKYAGMEFHPYVRIGNNVTINQNFHCTCAESIIIESGVSITANCGIFDIIHPYENVKENPRLAKISTAPVLIGENSMIGMNSVIMPGVCLGKHTIVGANSTVVSGHYPDNVVLAGSPARIIKHYDMELKKWVRN